LFLAVGVLGGFTTFSTFSYETLALIQDGEAWRAFLYVVFSVFLGLFLVLLGYRLGGALVA
ncbi:chromosome condensation protein CrcB, partial [Thermus scotoductus]